MVLFRTQWCLLLTGLALLMECGTVAAQAPGAALGASAAQEFRWQAYRSYTTEDGLPHNTILSLLQDHQGLLYAGTQQGLARFDGRGWTPIEMPAAARSSAVGVLAVDRDDALWLGTDSSGAWYWNRSEFQPVPLPAQSGPVNAFWLAADQHMWIGTGRGLFRCHRRLCKEIEGFADRGVRSLLGERGGELQYLWVGTGEQGLTRLEVRAGEQVLEVGPTLRKSDGLPNDVVIALARFGDPASPDLWVGTGRGIARFDGEHVRRYSSAEGFPTAMNFSLLADQDGLGRPTLYAGLRPGGLVMLDPAGDWQLVDARQALPAASILSVLRERYRGGLWLGTRSAGVLRAEAGRWAMLDERMGLPDRSSVGVGTLSPEQDVWVGSVGGAMRWQQGRFVRLLPAELGKLLVNDAQLAPDGLLWVATANGVLALRDGQLVHRYSADSSAVPSVSLEHLALLLHPDGKSYELYVGSGHGLVRWRSSSAALEHITELPSALTTQSISALQSG